jgi:hypothetical protein
MKTSRLVKQYKADKINRGRDKAKKLLAENLKSFKAEGGDIASFSPRELWTEAVGDPHILAENVTELTPADTTDFADILDEVLSQIAMEQYQLASADLGKLYERIPTRNTAFRVPGGLSSSAIADVAEAADYPEASMSDRYVSVSIGDKRGTMVSLTKELVLRDQTEIAVRQARAVGEQVAQDLQVQILTEILRPTTYNLDGTAVTNFWRDDASTWENLVEYTTSFDYEIFDNIFEGFAKMTESGDSRPIIVNPKAILANSDVFGTLAHMLQSTRYARDIGGDVESIADGPRGFEVQSRLGGDSPQLVDGASQLVRYVGSTLADLTVAGCFYIGDFAKQYKLFELQPIRFETAAAGLDDMWKRDIVASMKWSYWSHLQTVDHRFVIRVQPNTATVPTTTSAPTTSAATTT